MACRGKAPGNLFTSWLSSHGSSWIWGISMWRSCSILRHDLMIWRKADELFRFFLADKALPARPGIGLHSAIEPLYSAQAWPFLAEWAVGWFGAIHIHILPAPGHTFCRTFPCQWLLLPACVLTSSRGARQRALAQRTGQHLRSTWLLQLCPSMSGSSWAEVSIASTVTNRALLNAFLNAKAYQAFGEKICQRTMASARRRRRCNFSLCSAKQWRLPLWLRWLWTLSCYPTRPSLQSSGP